VIYTLWGEKTNKKNADFRRLTLAKRHFMSFYMKVFLCDSAPKAKLQDTLCFFLALRQSHL